MADTHKRKFHPLVSTTLAGVAIGLNGTHPPHNDTHIPHAITSASTDTNNPPSIEQAEKMLSAAIIASAKDISNLYGTKYIATALLKRHHTFDLFLEHGHNNEAGVLTGSVNGKTAQYLHGLSHLLAACAQLEIAYEAHNKEHPDGPYKQMHYTKIAANIIMLYDPKKSIPALPDYAGILGDFIRKLTLITRATCKEEDPLSNPAKSAYEVSLPYSVGSTLDMGTYKFTFNISATEPSSRMNPHSLKTAISASHTR